MRRGYRLIGLNDLLDGRIATPAGTTPVVLTFDDSSPGQFRYLGGNGTLRIDPKSAVGILEAFAKEHPDFGLGRDLLRAARSQPPQPPLRPARLRRPQAPVPGRPRLRDRQPHPLARQPRPVRRADGARQQIAEAQQWIQRHVSDYRIRTLALPHGVYPRDVQWALQGAAQGANYRHDAILMVAGGAAPSPFARTFDPVRLPRIQAVPRDLDHWFSYFERTPDERFVSDGDPSRHHHPRRPAHETPHPPALAPPHRGALNGRRGRAGGGRRSLSNSQTL